MNNIAKARLYSWAILATLMLSGCSLDNIVKVDKPQTGNDIEHEYFDTREGSLALLYSVMGTFQEAVSTTSREVSYFTDELVSRSVNSSDGSLGDYSSDSRFEVVDWRGFSGVQLSSYPLLHTTRIKSSHARYFLKRQADNSLNYAISASYSLEGYAIAMLAENVCSGVPLSQAPYGQAAVYGRGLPTDSLFVIAVAKFDSAIAIEHDSLRFKTLAKIGKARALSSLGRYQEASDVVTDIGENEMFNLTYTEAVTPVTDGSTPQPLDAFWSMPQVYRFSEIINREGNNGMMWYSNASSVDPRVPVTVNQVNGSFSFPAVVRQTKFNSGNVVFKLAGWPHAKMVEAENLLNKADPNWIVPINDARRSIGLNDTIAPSSESQKIDLLFRERAFWFYGQGTRLSDMRRLVRQYGRAVSSVYPIGIYTRSREVFSYGDATVFIPTSAEFVENYNYDGCIHKNP